jgi:signal transduction histidine kinase
MEEAQISERAKSEFIARVSHELRTPLNSIITPASILMGRTQEPADKEQLSLIQKSASSLLGLIQGILDFSELKKESVESAEPFLLDVFLQSLEEKWSPKAEKKGLTFTLETDQLSSPTACIGSIQNLRQAIEPLIDNAIKFTDSGVVALSVDPIGMVKECITYRFKISDSGIGIDQKQMKMLFEPFTQLESTDTRRHGGTGLGLAMAKRVVDRLGGKMEVTSEIEKGSSFYFTIPITADYQNVPETESPLDPSEIEAQLTKLSEIVDMGFIDIEIFLLEHVNKWSVTPWKEELLKIVDLINSFDADGALQAIHELKVKL